MVSTTVEVLLLTGLAGLAIPVGGILAHREHLRNNHFRADLLHAITAFAGGALLAAVALVLLPEGFALTTPLVGLLAFLIGAVGMLILSGWLSQRGTPAGQFMAMLADFVPESIALGAAVAVGSPAALLLALLIGLQNLPEGFSAYREVCREFEKRHRYFALWTLAGAALLGPVAGLVGLSFAHQEGFIGIVMVGASGAVLALVFQDVAPHAYRKGHVAPTLGAVGGFGLGLAGWLWLT